MAAMAIACIAIPLGIAIDLARWIITGHSPRISMTQEIVSSHFTWGMAIGSGAMIFWFKELSTWGLDEWRDAANTPLKYLLIGRVTTSGDQSETDKPINLD
jgi:hypothetical protein